MNDIHFQSCLLLTIVMGIARFFVEPTGDLSLSGSYEAAAHIFVGLLIGVWLTDIRKFSGYGVLAAVISIVELLVFFVGRVWV